MLSGPGIAKKIRKANGILKLLSKGDADIRDGRAKSQEDVFNEIENVLEKSRK